MPDDVPRLQGATLFISDGVMHMLPGGHELFDIADVYGNVLNTTTYQVSLVNRVWDFDLKTQQWSVHDSGIQDGAQNAAVAFDVKNQAGWYYGGYYLDNLNSTVDSQYSMKPTVVGPPIEYLQDLRRLDKGKDTPITVETDSSIVGNVTEGELIYIGGAGEAGILVLIGGHAVLSVVGEPNPNESCNPQCFFN